MMVSQKTFFKTGILLLAVSMDLMKHASTYTITDANNIHTTVFAGYNGLVLPDSPVIVQAEYNLMTVNSLDMKSQTLSSSGWFTVVWNDTRLSWDTATYGNIEYIYASQSSVWHPELIVENSVLDLSSLGDDDIQVRIRYDGEIRWEPPAILSTSCSMDVTYFPYDSQTCDIELASWGFHTDSVNLTFLKTGVNLQDYRTNGEWDLFSVSQFSSEITEDDFTYSELLFRIVLDRLPGYYIMSVIFPVILTSILTVVTFILPVESGEKVGYILTVLLALAVLLTLFADNMPTTSKHTSVLVVFLTVTLGMASIAIIFTILIIKLFHTPKEYIPPTWMQTFIHKFKAMKCKEKPRSGSVVEVKTTVEEDKEIEKVAWSDNNGLNDIKVAIKYSNRELAESFDQLLLYIFTVIYVLVVLCFTITLSVGD